MIENETTPTDDQRDAARWRALMQCQRLRMLGCAGFKGLDDYRHLGLEIWTHYGRTEELDKRSDEARELLTALADAVIASQTTPSDAARSDAP